MLLSEEDLGVASNRVGFVQAAVVSSSRPLET